MIVDILRAFLLVLAGYAWKCGARQGARKKSFFEKKDQKTFAPGDMGVGKDNAHGVRVRTTPTISTPTLTGLGNTQRERKFFGSFFQKRTASLL
jgi:hypothetical protein